MSGKIDNIVDAKGVAVGSDTAASNTVASNATVGNGNIDFSNPVLLSPEEQRHQVRVHYYVKIAVSTFLCALLLVIGVPVFMESRVTGSLAYTALGVVLVAFGLVLAAAVIVLLLRPPFNKDGTYRY